MSGFLKLRHHLAETHRLVQQLHRTNSFRVASLHSPLQALGAHRALHNSGVVTNYTVHSPFDDEIAGNSRERSGLLKRLAIIKARRIDRSNCRRSTVVQCDSRYTLSVLQQRYPHAVQKKGLVAPGWVDGATFVPTGDRQRMRAQLSGPWQTDVPVFFTLRRLENRMGLETLIEASRILKSRGQVFRTLIGGGGSLKEQLSLQIEAQELQENVFLLGRLAEDQLPLAYAAADCFVLPTRALECFGLIVLEAFACNTPVIASNVAAIPELAERQGKDWMFEPGNAEQLADRMQAFVEGRLRPSADLRSIAMEFDKPKILAEWERILVGEANHK